MIGWGLLYLLIIVALGDALTSLIRRNETRSLVEQAALSIVLGAGAMGTLLLALSMLGIAPHRSVIVAIGIISFVLLAVQFVKRASRPCAERSHERDARVTMVLCLLPILGLIIANLLAAIPALGMPFFEWDSFVIWGLKAKVLYYSPLRPLPDYFTDVGFSYSHLDYPLLFPMLMAGAYAMMGQVNEELGKGILPLLFAGQTLMAYVGARIWLNRLAALAVALLLIGAPFNVQFAGLGTADMTLTTFRLASMVYLVKCIKQVTRPSPEPSPGVPGEGIENVVFCSLFTFFAAMTKSEGLPLAILNFLLIAFFAVRGRKWNEMAAFSIPLAIGLTIWLLFSSRLPHTDEAYFSRLTLANLQAGLPHLLEILQSLLKAFVDYQNWGLLWLLLPVLAAFRFPSFKSRVIAILWLSLLAHLSIYILIYLITPWNLSDLLPVTIPRLLLHIAPTAMLLVAGHAGAILRVASPPPNRI